MVSAFGAQVFRRDTFQSIQYSSFSQKSLFHRSHESTRYAAVKNLLISAKPKKALFSLLGIPKAEGEGWGKKYLAPDLKGSTLNFSPPHAKRSSIKPQETPLEISRNPI